MNRNEAREQAFLLIFSESFNSEQSIEELISNALEANDYENDEYTFRLIKGVSENKAQIDEIIAEKLNKWKMERLPKTTLAILRLAVFEIIYCDDIPDSVSINEAVELAKRFGSEKDYSFVNGVLGNISRAKQ